ncbi:MAG: MAPEG family protein [Myxococcota bacterium]
MSTELAVLVATALLSIVLPVTYVSRLIMLPGGQQWQGGNREGSFAEEPGWITRARKAHSNLVENLVVFAALVLAAHLSDSLGSMTRIGSIVFFAGRVLHAIAYTAGLVPWRTVAFFVGLGGTLLVAAPMIPKLF